MRQRVLVPIDGSPEAERALEYALDLPEVTIALLTVINPFDLDPLTPGYQSPIGRAGMPAYSGEGYEGAKAEINEVHEQLKTRVTGQNTTLTNTIRVGHPVNQIIKHADENDIDHIVMGTHGRTGASRILSGSVAEGVVRRSPVPVTVVR